MNDCLNRDFQARPTFAAIITALQGLLGEALPEAGPPPAPPAPAGAPTPALQQPAALPA